MSSGAARAVVIAWAAVAITDGFATMREVSAQSSGDTQSAQQVLVESNRRHRPKTEEYVGEITVIARDGKERHKEWIGQQADESGEVDRLIRFLSPPDVTGVAYLSRHKTGKNPDEWLYLPSMKRERRIAASDRDAAFVGTSFSYEDLDLLDFKPADYEATFAPGGGAGDTYAIALVPHAPSAYSRKVLTLRRDTLDLLAIDYYTRDSRAAVKRLTVSGYEAIGGYTIATRIEMADYRKANRTVIALRDIVVDRPQPSDRYTIQNLLREDEARLPASHGPARNTARFQSSNGETPSHGFGMPGVISGYVEARGFASFNVPSGETLPAQWATAVVRDTVRIGPAHVDASVRLEESSSSQVGPIVFDPADRLPRRSPLSIRTLSLAMPVHSGVDLTLGRFDLAWGETDGYSPADAFLPRDLSDPLTEERLPLWGADLTGESHGIRFEALAVPVTTPWRLPPLGTTPLPIATMNVSFIEQPWQVPKTGFGAGRIMGSVNDWDVGAWVRFGERPAPVLDPDQANETTVDNVLQVPLNRHFTTETAVGGSASREVGGWIVQSEFGWFDSPDPDVGRAAIITFGGSRVVRNGIFTATVAANAIATPVDPLLLFDRALLPAVILATHQVESWGSWRVVWLATFHTVGGILSAEATRNVTDTIGVTAALDAPHGAALSPATAFTGGKRARGEIRVSW